MRCVRRDKRTGLQCRREAKDTHPWCTTCRTRHDTRHRKAHANLHSEIAHVRKTISKALSLLETLEIDVRILEQRSR